MPVQLFRTPGGRPGFQGAAKTVDGKPESAFKMFVGGSDKLGAAKFGGEAGAVILECDLPKFSWTSKAASQNMNRGA